MSTRDPRRTPGLIRIIGGHLRRRRIDCRGKASLRPTPDAVRETLFNWIAADITGANCLDLFAGSGALGFEALSRGASAVTMVENDRHHLPLLEANRANLGAPEVRILGMDARVYLRTPPAEPFDIVFLDPPFGSGLLEAALAGIGGDEWLTPGALVYAETARDHNPLSSAPGWHIIRHNHRGGVAFFLLRRERSSPFRHQS